MLNINKTSFLSLNLSKVKTYGFQGNYILRKHMNNSKLLLTNTDGWLYDICSEDAYKDFWKDEEQFNLKEYSKNAK